MCAEKNLLLTILADILAIIFIIQIIIYPPAIDRVVEITYDCVSISIIICTANDTFPSIFMLNRKRQVIENSTINYQRLMYLSAVLKVYIRYVYVVIVVKAMILQRMY